MPFNNILDKVCGGLGYERVGKQQGQQQDLEKADGNIKSNTNEELEPPSYNSCNSIGIKATDTPQWLWTNAQCRAWITIFAHESLGLDIQTARDCAAIYEGNGALIYTLKPKYWAAIFPKYMHAASCCAFFISVRDQKGAIPSTIQVMDAPATWELIGRELRLKET